MFITPCVPTNYYKNNYQIKIKNSCSDLITFMGNIPSKPVYSAMIQELEKCKTQNNSKPVQKLYQYNIDFLNKKMDKKTFMLNMYKLFESTPKEKWGTINKSEARYIGNFGVYFDLNGPASVNIKTKDIIDTIEMLLGR